MSTIKITILGTSDLHLHLLPYDYYADIARPQTGLASLATTIREIRSTPPNALLFDNGDFLQGTPFSDIWAYHRPENVAHPLFPIFKELGFDAVGLGNHEFNYGLDYLSDIIADAEMPVLAGNVMTPDGDPLFQTSAVLDRMMVDTDGNEVPIKIGVLALVPPQISIWDREHLEGRVVAQDMVERAKDLAAELRSQGADIIIGLCHSGFDSGDAIQFQENALVPLSQTGVFDAIIGGHTHLPFPVDDNDGMVHDTPIVLPAPYGRSLGRIDLVFNTGDGVTDTSSYLIPAAEDADPTVCELAAPAHAATLAFTQAEIGTAPVQIQSFFSLIAADTSIAIIADAQRYAARVEFGLSNDADLPLLSAVAPFRFGGRAGPDHFVDIPAGPLKRAHAAELYEFPNRPSVIRVDGATIHEWLEQSARVFHQIPEGASDAELIDTSVPAYDFDILDGLTYTFDLSQPARYDRFGQQVADTHRVSNICYQGHPIKHTDRFLVVTNNYRADGGGYFNMLRQSDRLHVSQRQTRDFMAAYIASGTCSFAARQTWQFKPTSQTTAVFLTSPKARQATAPKRVEGPIDHVGGLDQYRLHL